MSVGRIVTASGEDSAPLACAICSRESSVGRRQVLAWLGLGIGLGLGSGLGSVLGLGLGLGLGLARCGRSTRAARGVRASHEHSMIEGSFVPSFD